MSEYTHIKSWKILIGSHISVLIILFFFCPLDILKVYSITGNKLHNEALLRFLYSRLPQHRFILIVFNLLFRFHISVIVNSQSSVSLSVSECRNKESSQTTLDYLSLSLSLSLSLCLSLSLSLSLSVASPKSKQNGGTFYWHGHMIP